MDQQTGGQPGQGQKSGRRRRRRRKGGSGGGQANGQNANPGNGQPNGQGNHQHRAQGQGQHRRHDGGQGGGFGRQRRDGGGGGGRRNRQGGGRGRRQPAAFVGPMDHSYREPNGNVADPRRGGVPSRFQQPDIQPVTSVSADAPAVIYCFIEDLFFLAKINETARKLGIKVEFVKSVDPVLERASDDIPEHERPSLAIVDLANHKLKPLDVIKKLRTKLKKTLNIIGFIPHVEGELKLKAQEAGCDTVMPRSAFSQALPNLLRRYGAPEEDDNIGNQ